MKLFEIGALASEKMPFKGFLSLILVTIFLGGAKPF